MKKLLLSFLLSTSSLCFASLNGQNFSTWNDPASTGTTFLEGPFDRTVNEIKEPAFRCQMKMLGALYSLLGPNINLESELGIRVLFPRYDLEFEYPDARYDELYVLEYIQEAGFIVHDNLHGKVLASRYFQKHFLAYQQLIETIEYRQQLEKLLTFHRYLLTALTELLYHQNRLQRIQPDAGNLVAIDNIRMLMKQFLITERKLTSPEFRKNLKKRSFWQTLSEW